MASIPWMKFSLLKSIFFISNNISFVLFIAYESPFIIILQLNDWLSNIFLLRPMVMLVGQYSTGKTTFIRYLLEQDFPGIRIGPEPTTDRFIAVMHADSDGVIPGNALVVDPKKQFRPLSKFGNAFLNRFQCSGTNSQVLKGISIVDTPGILRWASGCFVSREQTARVSLSAERSREQTEVMTS